MENKNQKVDNQHGPTAPHHDSQKFTGDSERNKIHNENTNPKVSNPNENEEEIYQSSEERKFHDTGIEGIDKQIDHSHKSNKGLPSSEPNFEQTTTDSTTSHSDDSNFSDEEREVINRNKNLNVDARNNNEIE